MKKVIKTELKLGMDSCVRALNMLRRTNVETSHSEMNDRLLTIAAAEEKKNIWQLWILTSWLM